MKLSGGWLGKYKVMVSVFRNTLHQHLFPNPPPHHYIVFRATLAFQITDVNGELRISSGGVSGTLLKLQPCDSLEQVES